MLNKKTNIKRQNTEIDNNQFIDEIYKSVILKLESGEELTPIEQRIHQTLTRGNTDKQTEAKQLQNLLDEAYSVLNNSPNWKIEHNKLFEVLEKIVFLGVRESAFQDYFNVFERSIADLMRLNFKSEIDLSLLIDKKLNLLNYIAAAFVMVKDTLEVSVVSNKVINSFLQIAIPDLLFIVVDSQLNIRFINNKASDLIGIPSEEMIGVSVTKWIKGDIPLPENDETYHSKLHWQLKNTKKELFLIENISVQRCLDDPNQVNEYILAFNCSEEDQ